MSSEATLVDVITRELQSDVIRTPRHQAERIVAIVKSINPGVADAAARVRFTGHLDSMSLEQLSEMRQGTWETFPGNR